MEYLIRKANVNDCPAIEQLIALSARELSTQDYSHEQIEGALEGAFGLDTQLIRDATYFVVESGGVLIGCGGWSKRKTLFGGDRKEARDSAELDPETDPGKIRAFFVHPDWARKGIGRAILARCESEAISSGFRSLELLATLPGVRLYSACGFVASEPIEYRLPSGITIEFVPMKKVLAV
jgi:N-acetylglutamate synthase-like GNAT family acetyltransferase